MLSEATCLVSNGNYISSLASPTRKTRQSLKRDKEPWPVLVCRFVHFAAYDFKNRLVATGNGARRTWQQHDFNVKTWWPNLVTPYSVTRLIIIVILHTQTTVIRVQFGWFWNHAVSIDSKAINLTHRPPFGKNCHQCKNCDQQHDWCWECIGYKMQTTLPYTSFFKCWEYSFMTVSWLNVKCTMTGISNENGKSSTKKRRAW